MDADGTPKDDVKVPETDIGKEISTSYEDGKDLMVTIIAAMGKSQVFLRITSLETDFGRIGEEQAISWKEAPQEK